MQQGAKRTALMSTSFQTMRGFLPPSSMVTFFTVSAADFRMILPTAVEPVKDTCAEGRQSSALQQE